MDRKSKLIEFLKDNPADSFLNHALALEFIRDGQDDEARKLFESILERDPDYVGTYYHLAKLLERKGDLPLAVHWYEKGIRRASECGDTHAMNELKAALADITE